MEENENQEVDSMDDDMESSEEAKTSRETEGKKPMLMVLAVLAVLALGAFFIFGAPKPQEDNEQFESTEMDETIDDNSTMEQDELFEEEYVLDEEEVAGDSEYKEGVNVIEVEGGSYYYSPNIIEVQRGDSVRIVLTSVDMMHDFVIDEIDVKSDIVKSGETGVVEFTVDEVGEYEFYCSVGNHRAQGMVGTLVVTE